MNVPRIKWLRDAELTMHPAVSNGSYDIARIRADFPALAMQVYGKPLVYLDNAASAQGGRRVDEPRLTSGPDVRGDVGAGPVEQREVLRSVDRDASEHFLAGRADVVARLEHVADYERDREAVAHVGAAAEGQRHGEPTVVPSRRAGPQRQSLIPITRRSPHCVRSTMPSSRSAG